MADQGFTQYLSDFAKVMKENGEDIIETTEAIETLFADVLSKLTADGKIEGMADDIREGINDFLEALEGEDFFNADTIKNTFSGIVDQAKDALDIDLGLGFDKDDILQSFKDLVPDTAFPPELEKALKPVKDFLDNFDMSDIKIRLKTISEPVAKPGSQAQSATLAGLSQATIASNFNISPPAGTNISTPLPPSSSQAELDSLFDKIVTEITSVFSTKESLFTGILDKLEQTITESGFFMELETRREAFIKSLTSSGGSITKILDAIATLIAETLSHAIRTILAILESILTELKEFLQMIQGLIGKETGSVVSSLFEQFGVQGFSPTLFSLPALLISIPLTLITKALTGEKPSFPDVFQDEAQEITNHNNKVYGSMQLIKVIGPVFNTIAERLKDTSMLKLVLDVIGNLWGPFFDFIAQLHSEPLHPSFKSDRGQHIADLHERFFGHKIWQFQWVYNVAWSILAAGVNFWAGFEKRRYETRNKRRSYPADRKALMEKLNFGTDIILPGCQAAFEIIHFGMFTFLLHLENKAEEAENAGATPEELKDMVPSNDSRLQAGYMMDAIPGIIGGFVSLGKTFIDYKVDSEEGKTDTSKDIIRQHIASMRRKITNGNRSISNDEAVFLTLTGAKGVNDNLGELTEYRRLVLGDNGIIAKFQAIKGLLDTIGRAHQEPGVARMISDAKAIIRTQEGDNWDEILRHYQSGKPIIHQFRDNTRAFLTKVQPLLTGVRDNLVNDDKAQIKRNLGTLRAWKSEIDTIKRDLKRIRTDVLNNKLLIRLFIDNRSHLSLVQASLDLQEELDEGIMFFLSVANSPHHGPLGQAISALGRVTSNLNIRQPRVRDFLRLYTRPRSIFARNYHLFPPVSMPENALNEMAFEINGLITHGENLEKRTSPANLSRLKKLHIGLTGADFAIMLILQIIYGSLYINTGVDP